MLKSNPWQRLRGRGLSRPLVALVLALVLLGAASALHPPLAPNLAAAADKGTVLDAIIDMTCFPVAPQPPPIVLDQPPPCSFPEGINPYSSPTPSGQAHLLVKADDTVQVDITLQGFAPGGTVAAIINWYFQFLYPYGEGGELLPDLFLSVDADKDLVDILGNIWVPYAQAGHSVPLAPTTAGFTEGLGPEPNQIFIDQDGNGRLTVKLDYNPLKPNQGPLRNSLVSTNQGGAPEDSVAFQPGCCSGLFTRGSGLPPLQPVGASFLREWDRDTGFQVLDDNGRPKLVRSPVPALFIAISYVLDKHLKGISAGLPRTSVPPPVNVEVFGDHVIAGVIDLRPFHMPGE
jgi:hypothetical protein